MYEDLLFSSLYTYLLTLFYMISAMLKRIGFVWFYFADLVYTYAQMSRNY